MPTIVYFGDEPRLKPVSVYLREAEDEFQRGLLECMMYGHGNIHVPSIYYGTPRVTARSPFFNVDELMKTLKPKWLFRPQRVKIKPLRSVKSILGARISNNAKKKGRPGRE